MTKRSLVLRREQLTELTTADLAHVAGAAPPDGQTKTCPDYTYHCVTGYALCGDILPSRINCG